MVQLELYNDLYIQVNTQDLGYLQSVKEFFTEYVDGYIFMPLYKSGQWDGKISLYKILNRTFPYGLLFDFIKFHKNEFPEIDLFVSDEIKNKFKGENLLTEFDLKYEPRPYQLDCINTALKHKSNIFVVGTGGGKCVKNIEIEVEMSDEDYKKYFSDYKTIDNNI